MTESCYFCKGKVVQQSATVDFWWGDDLKIIENVPAGVCAQCGEKYFDSPVYKQMERLAKGASKTVRQFSVDVVRYSAA
jgi:YgiT-type zinc finger domain-containing protein